MNDRIKSHDVSCFQINFLAYFYNSKTAKTLKNAFISLFKDPNLDELYGLDRGEVQF